MTIKYFNGGIRALLKDKLIPRDMKL